MAEYKAKLFKNVENNLDHYSTTAIKVGKWIDGSDIYRKVYSLGEVTANQIKYLDASLTTKKPISWGGYASVGANKVFFPYVNVSSVAYSVQLNINTINGLTFIAGGNFTCSDGYLWVDYV